MKKITQQLKRILKLLTKNYVLRNIRNNFSDQWILVSPKGSTEIVPSRTAIELLEYTKVKDELFIGNYVISNKGLRTIK